MKETSMAPWMTLAILAAFAAGVLSGTLLRRRQSTAAEAAISGNASPTGRGEERSFAGLLSGGRTIAVAAITGLVVLGLVGLYASIEAPEPTSGPSPNSGQGPP